MNIKTLATGLLTLSLAVLPSVASADELFGHVVHLDLTAGSVEERVIGTDATNLSTVSGHLYSNLNKTTTVYVNGAESYVSHSGFLIKGYTALTGAIGLDHHFNNRFSAQAEAGNRVNDQQYLSGSNRTIPYAGVSVTERVF